MVHAAAAVYPTPQELLTCADVGRALDPPLTPAAVRAAADAGRIAVAVKTQGGQRLFTHEEAARFQAMRSAAKAALSNEPQARRIRVRQVR